MRLFKTIALLATVAVAPLAANATAIAWTTWNYPAANTPPTYAAPGVATGTLIINGVPVTVTYTGQVINTSAATDWSPTTSFDGGIGPAPPNGNAEVALWGGQTYTETISFSSPVTDPILAIWSLGQTGITAEFDFAAGQPFTITSGGSNAQYGGSSIYSIGNNVYGVEGNGDVQFAGTYSSLSFTTPVYENYYTFTVGSPVPEPSSLALLGTGALGIAGFARRKFLRA